ncbi:MAG: protoporphyrinogen oxidase [Gemmatimonadetes bacterium]|nr:protoporphyrinogen oxidase [Gemmatimonadota bacterium]
MRANHRVVVVGAGISGLAAAAGILRRAKGAPLDLRVLEAAERPGGKIWTLRDEGVLHETGPNGWLDSAPSTGALVRHLGLDSKIVRADAAAERRFVLKHGDLTLLPANPAAFLRSPILSGRAKLRVAAELIVPRRDPAAGDESLADFGRRRLGAEALTWLLDPFVTGIHAGDPERISVTAAFPKIAALESKHGGLFRGMIAGGRARRRARAAGGRRGGGAAGPGGTLTSLEGGLRTLVEAIAELLGDRLLLGQPVEAVEPGGDDGSFIVRSADRCIEADQVVLAVPAPATAKLLQPFAQAAARACLAIPHAPVSVVETLFDRADVGADLTGFGFLCPGAEGRRILGSLWTSSIFPGARAPSGKVLLRTLVGGRRQSELALGSESDLLSLVLDELRVILAIEGSPERSFITRWQEAIPQYELGHCERVATIDRDLPARLHLVGNAFRGIGINDCTAAAEGVAERVVSGRGA